jgi:hypothetical protein
VTQVGGTGTCIGILVNGWGTKLAAMHPASSLAAAIPITYRDTMRTCRGGRGRGRVTDRDRDPVIISPKSPRTSYILEVGSDRYELSASTSVALDSPFTDFLSTS